MKTNMKNKKVPVPQKNYKADINKTRPDIRDNLDHREGEEQDFKGNDVTHNKKNHHRLPKKKK